MNAEQRKLTRRSLLIAGASGLGAAGLGATLGLTFGADSPAAVHGVTRFERVYSAARRREIDFITFLPPNPAPGLPMSLLLHGLHSSARYAAPTGLVDRLATDVAAGAVPAFGFVAVDGGDSYWHENQPGDDPMTMLLEEVPRWLAARGLGGDGGLPFAATGISMGGFGALLYTRRRVERHQPTSAVATLAPALITTWPEMSKRNAFHDAADWASMDPLRHVSALKGVQTGIWCGTEDQFITGVREYFAAAQPAVAYTAPGVHGDSFNRTVVPGLVAFVGRNVPGQRFK
ncbi:MAG: alpha/beta hydrolase [Amycolatopsis sp.]|uniref:alpha/beta hydrolase n=1 Tax=Amycolatopsis sp. TaxID=37632 RepID=UPI00262D11ED|nr:alpha/beta hydrolase-fold protein [Amycolatopsis sp.]MCU1681223.1 alpha/beta hydrolase [Amycolatopsis sp.]